MKCFAIRRKKDRALISGTDYRQCPPHSIFANEYRRPLLYGISEGRYSLPAEIKNRNINLKKYEITVVEVTDLGTEEVPKKVVEDVKAFLKECNS